MYCNQRKKVENSELFYMALNSPEYYQGKKSMVILKFSLVPSMWKEMYYKVRRKWGKALRVESSMIFHVFRSSAEAKYVVKDCRCPGLNPKIEN